MKATEARDLALKKGSTQLKQILKSIKEFSIKGEFSFWFYENLEVSTRKDLKNLGYEVGETQFERNEYLTKISW